MVIVSTKDGGVMDKTIVVISQTNPGVHAVDISSNVTIVYVGIVSGFVMGLTTVVMVVMNAIVPSQPLPLVRSITVDIIIEQ